MPFRLPIPSIPSFQTPSPVPNVLPPSSTGVPVVSVPSAATAETPAQVQAEVAGVSSATGDKKIPVVLIAGVGIAAVVAYFVFKKKGA
jgi:LPXTG-motif cell wall-anchored protein